jgi:predicted Zn-ribbon and HTH transcriptional regulator
MQCPRCTSEWIRPGYRRAVDRLLTVAWMYPYRCQACAYKFRRFKTRHAKPPRGERREFERIPATRPVFFWNAECHGEGTLVNLSAAGCWVDGAIPVQDGAPMELLIHTPTGESIDTAGLVARLTPGKGFALQFLESRPDRRLHALLQQCHAAVPA